MAPSRSPAFAHAELRPYCASSLRGSRRRASSVLADGLGHVSEPLERERAVYARRHQRRSEPDRLVEGPNRTFEVAAVAERHPETIMRCGVAGIDSQRGAELRTRAREVASRQRALSARAMFRG